MKKIFWLSVILVLIFDRITKYLIKMTLQPQDSIALIKDFLHITYVENTGAAFGLFTDNRWLFVVVTIFVLAILIYLAYTEATNKKALSIILGLIAGGGAGNLIDRITEGYVLDFIDFRGLWPYVFNFADAALVIGAVLLLITFILNKETGENDV